VSFTFFSLFTSRLVYYGHHPKEKHHEKRTDGSDLPRQLGNTGRQTGFWLEELAAPYYAFKDAGAKSCSPRPWADSRRWIRKATNHRSRPT
jgi:hypothetical protein